MSKLIFMLLIGCNAMAFALQEPSNTTEITNHSTYIVLLDNESVTVFGESFEYKGKNLLKIIISNKTGKPIKCQYSISVENEHQVLNYDGMVESILNIDAYSTFEFGDPNNQEPIIEIKGDWTKTTKVELTLLKL